MKKLSLALAVSLIAGVATQTPALAGYGGASPFGANPELKLTIAEREQIKRLYREKGRAPFAGNVNQRRGDKAIFFQIDREDRDRGIKPRKPGRSEY